MEGDAGQRDTRTLVPQVLPRQDWSAREQVLDRRPTCLGEEEGRSVPREEIRRSSLQVPMEMCQGPRLGKHVGQYSQQGSMVPDVLEGSKMTGQYRKRESDGYARKLSSGRLRPVKLMFFIEFERPLSGKADIQVLSVSPPKK